MRRIVKRRPRAAATLLMALATTGVALAQGLALVGFRYVQSQMAYERDERALDQVTTSELVPLRLTPASTAVQIGKLARDAALFEIEAVAVIPNRAVKAAKRSGSARRGKPIKKTSRKIRR